MKKTSVVIAGALMAFAMVFMSSSCTKKEDASKSTAKKEAPKITQEQAKRIEEIKQEVKESKKIVVARVNGADITMHSLVKEMNLVAPKIIPAGKLATPEITNKVKEKALNNLIFRELAVQEAIKEGITVKAEAVDAVIAKVKAQGGSDEAYKQYLQERGLTEEALRKVIERDHLFEMITAKEIYQKIPIDDQALRAEYEKDKSLLVTKDNPPRQLSFEEAKYFLVRKIKSERSGKRIAEWDKELRKKAKIEVIPSKT